MEKEIVDRSHMSKSEYADYFEVGHNFVAFYLDCGQVNQSDETSCVYNRIITTPIGAQRLSAVLKRALFEYVRLYGAIRDESGQAFQVEDRVE